MIAPACFPSPTGQRVGNYYALPNWTADGKLASLDATALKVLLMLARRANPGEVCSLPIGEIAPVVRSVPRNVRRAILRLEEVGAIKVERSSGGDPRDSGNTFYLLDWCPQEAPGAEVSPDIYAPGQVVTPDRCAPRTPGAEVRGPLTSAPGLPLAQKSASQEQRQETRNASARNLSRNGAGACEAFDAFWATYPRKTAKKAALKAWRAAVRDVQLERRCDEAAAGEILVTAARAYAESDKGRGEVRYIPHPATWLNAGTYGDDPAEWSARKRVNGNAVPNFL